ncbi:pyrroline-5-carboxylate reductase [Candidatus Woesearchaeota archaeon]|nr:pyrroline-5-carboxylate reductase [Candidatus Woesearchaeota archaeon]
MHNRRIGFIGSGNMATALAVAFKGAGLLGNAIASDKDFRKGAAIREKAGVLITTDNGKVAKETDAIFLCVKPQDIPPVMDEIRKDVKGKLIISIAAGVSIKKLEQGLPRAKIIRVMPNTPCVVGEMAAGFSLGKKVNGEEGKFVKNLLNAAGKAYAVPEELLDAVTAVSGSGPAFFAYLYGCFIRAGIKQGLPEKICRDLVLQTAKGTAVLLEKAGMTPEQLIEMVSSPKGTTVEGRKVIENARVENIINRAVARAKQRSEELRKA